MVIKLPVLSLCCIVVVIMTEFIFIRHCQSSMNLTPDIICGQNNTITPTELGIQQSKTLGEYLADISYEPDEIYSSPAVRAHETGRIALDAAGIYQDINLDDRLLEQSYGSLEGLDSSKIFTARGMRRYRFDQLTGKAPRGESIRDVQDRMLDFILEKETEQPGGKILVFSHAMAISSLISKIRNLTARETIDLPLPNTSLTQITVESGRPTVDFTGQLPAVATS